MPPKKSSSKGNGKNKPQAAAAKQARVTDKIIEDYAEDLLGMIVVAGPRLFKNWGGSVMVNNKVLKELFVGWLEGGGRRPTVEQQVWVRASLQARDLHQRLAHRWQVLDAGARWHRGARR